MTPETIKKMEELICVHWDNGEDFLDAMGRKDVDKKDYLHILAEWYRVAIAARLKKGFRLQKAKRRLYMTYPKGQNDGKT